MFISHCRSCFSEKLEKIISLGLSPLANNLLNDKNDIDELYPLDVVVCNDCFSSQLSYTVPPQKLFDTYLYVSSTTKSFRDHFFTAAEKYINQFKLSNESVVVDIGSNDGIALTPFQQKGIKVIGVEPAKNISKLANEKGIETINSYFNNETTDEILKNFGKVDLVTASNVFAHSDEIHNITNNVFRLLKNDGCFVVEVQYLLDTINDMTFDNIYHEHVNYWTVTSLNNFFNKLNLYVVKVEHIETHGGSIRVYVKNSNMTVDDSVEFFLKKEIEFGILKKDTYNNFFEKIKETKKNVNRNLKYLKDKGYKIAGYGSPAKATTALNYFEAGTNYIDYILEDNHLKHNKFIPGVKIPIFSKEYIKRNKPDVIVIMAWNFANEIVKNNKELVDLGIKFISIKQLQREHFDENIMAL